MIAGDKFSCTFVCRSGSQVGLNVLHYRVVTATNLGVTSQEMADFLSQRVAPTYTTWLPTTAEYRGCQVQVYSPVALVAAKSILGQAPGLNGATQEPRQVSGVIKWGTDRAGKSNRGRSYIPFVASANVQNVDSLTATGVAQLTSLGTSISQSATVNGVNGTAQFRMVIQHKAHDTGEADVTSMLARNILGTQRRRGPFGAQNPIPLI